MDIQEKNIIFYDGDCGFCNRTVQLILRFERNKEILFSPIQSEFTKDFFKNNNAPQPDLSTFYFYTNYVLLTKSTAALALLPFLKFPFILLNIFRIIPICQRDQLYDFIAKRRKKISVGYCVIPTEQQKTRFLS